jgi:hypothetical protein
MFPASSVTLKDNAGDRENWSDEPCETLVFTVMTHRLTLAVIDEIAVKFPNTKSTPFEVLRDEQSRGSSDCNTKFI